MFPVASNPATRHNGASVIYTHTAFVSAAGNDGTATLNSPSHPYLTMGAAVTALHATYSGNPTTLRILNDLGAGGLASSSDLNDLLNAGLTIKGHGGVRTINSVVSFGTATDASLTLDDITINSLTKPPHTATSGSAGTITGIGTVLISSLALTGAAGADGLNGGNGGTDTGSPDGPAQPPAASPPTPGTPGGSASADGGDGDVPVGGSSGWNLTLLGVGTITTVDASGGAGGNGGIGGNGGVANGGNGGKGGDSNALANEDGAAGGDGGSANARGGDGHNGGDGGNGGSILNTAGAWTIGISTLGGGAGGNPGAGGGAGTANPGSGGAGGAGALLGSDGANGSNGAGNNSAGSNGAAAGSQGSSGAITT